MVDDSRRGGELSSEPSTSPNPARQMVRLPEFDGVFRALQRSLRQAGLMG